MAVFKIAHEGTRKSEGGYTDHPDDNGNWTGGKKGLGKLIGTKYGVSAPMLKTHLKREPTVSDMKFLDYAAALKIFEQYFWTPLRGNEIENQALANQVYDMSVNAGVGAGIKLAEEVVGLMPSRSAKMYDALLNKMNNV